MVHALEISDGLRTKLNEEYATDEEMVQLVRTIKEGFVQHKSSTTLLLRPYWNMRDRLFVKDGFCYMDGRLVVPKNLRKKFISTIHAGHMGMQKSKDRARQSVYWPGLADDIDHFVQSCSACVRFSNRQVREPLMPHDVPKLPWNTVAMDILSYRDRPYLVVVDCFSHYPELRLLSDKTASQVILALKSIFAVHGIPVRIFADNMPFSSQAMIDFSEEYDFDIATSSPHFPPE